MATLAPLFLILQVTRTIINSRQGSNFGRIRQPTAELAALERFDKSPKTYNWRYVVATLAPSFLIESSSFL